MSSRLSSPNLTLKHEDFLKYDSYPAGKKYIFISNLPYSISGEAVKHFIENDAFDFGVLMLQKEFADRMESPAGSANYGPMSVIVQNFLDIKKLYSVGRGNFFPEPKVDSLVISIQKKHSLPPKTSDDNFSQRDFSAFIKTAFLAKRKTLANNLSKTPYAVLADMDIAKKRPDAISPEEWAELFRLYQNSL